MFLPIRYSGDFDGLSGAYSQTVSQYLSSDAKKAFLQGRCYLQIQIYATSVGEHWPYWDGGWSTSIFNLELSYSPYVGRVAWRIQSATSGIRTNPDGSSPIPPLVHGDPGYLFLDIDEFMPLMSAHASIILANSDGIAVRYTFTPHVQIPDGYSVKNPVFQDVPDFYHYASLYKAGGQILGKELGLYSTSPVGLDVWFLDDLSDELFSHVPRQLIAGSNLLDEIDLPFKTSPILTAFPELCRSVTINFNVQSGSLPVTQVPFNFNSDDYQPDTDGGDIMGDSNRLIAIFDALDAGKYSKSPLSPDAPRFWNLGMMLHGLTMANGLNFDPDGKPRPPEPYVQYADGDEVSDRFGRGQAGIEYRQVSGELTPVPGFLYSVLTPRFGVNPFTGEASDLLTGGMLGCSNHFQLSESARFDMSKAIGVDQSVGVIPSADGGYTTYEGLMDVVTESLHMDSRASIVQMKTFINSQKGVQMLQEMFEAIGLAVDPKKFEILLEGVSVSAIYPGFADSSPSLVDLICLGLLQLAHILPQTMALPSPTLVENPPTPSIPPISP